MSNSDSDEQPQAEADFGRALAEARKAKNYSVAQVSENLKIPERVIEAIEDSNLDALPEPIYTQGYIRTYARFLEVSEDDAVAAYNRNMPQEPVSELKPRSTLPGEHSSQSPLVKSVTMALVVAGLFAVVYGVFQYYQEKASDLETSQQLAEEGDSEDRLELPDADVAADAGDNLPEEFSREQPVDEESDSLAENEVLTEAVVEDDTGAVPEETPVAATDTLEIYAEKGAWLEVYDDTNARLFYNMVKSGDTKVLTGQAPFRIKVGNADVTRVTLNGIDVDMSGHTRRNNTAVFTVSERDGDIVYH